MYYSHCYTVPKTDEEFLTKYLPLTKLEQEQCFLLAENIPMTEIRDSIKDPEFCTVIHLKEANNTIAQVHQELMNLETGCRALW